MYDANYLNEHADLKEVYERVTGNTLKRHSDQWEGACPNCGGTKRFRIPDRFPHRGFCRECGKSFSAIDIVLSRYDVPFREACDMLADMMNLSSDEAQYKRPGGLKTESPKVSDRATNVCVLPDEPSDKWQYAVTEAVNHAHDVLMSKAGTKEREYLYRRGFTDETLRRYHIGFNPTQRLLDVTVIENGQVKPVKASVGYYIPTFVRLMDDEPYQSLLRVKVRMEDWKYKAMMKAYEEGRGEKPNKYWHIRSGITAKSLFCADYMRNVDTNENIIFTEGEFDAMTINQVAGDICHAVSFGSHSNISGTADYWHAWFCAPSHTVVCFDNESDPTKAEQVKKHEQELADEILRAQNMDDPRYRGEPPVVQHLPEQYHDWNDILTMPNGTQIIREKLKEFFRN